MNPLRRLLPVRRIVAVLSLVGVLLPGGIPAANDPETARLAAATLVLYNSSDPMSETMARFYALKRAIPSEHVIGLNCPVTEEITREDYETTIERPLRDLFHRNHWWRVENHPSQGLIATSNRIRFVAVMRGIPLKVLPRQLVPQGGPTPLPVPTGKPTPPPTPTPPPPKPTERQEAAVDSELAALGIFTKPLAGPAPNPYYNSYTPILDAGLPPILLVCRLDGPNLMTVRNMLLDSLEAEQTGVGGMAYIDTRNLRSGSYVEGDNWLRNAADDFRSHGIPTILDTRAETLPAGYAAARAGFYLGWYTQHADGPFAEPTFRFRKGAVAVHLHSFSAATLRNPTQYWCAPLLERGAAATLGNVYEPYLDLTPHLDIFTDRLLSGFSFAEAAYMSVKSLSWMTTPVGDPLYRPFKRWNSLDTDGAPAPDVALWDDYRTTVLKWIQTKDTSLFESPRHSPTELGVFLEGAADLLQADGQNIKAFQLLEKAMQTYTDPADQSRVAFHLAQQILARDGKEAAVTFLQRMIRAYEGTPYATSFAAYESVLNPPPPPPTPASSPAATGTKR